MEHAVLTQMIETLLAGIADSGISLHPAVEPLQQIEDLLQGVGRTQAPIEVQSAVPAQQTHEGGFGGAAVLKTLFGGLGLISLFSGLFGGGHEEQAVPPLLRYELPPAIDLEAGYSAGQGFSPLIRDESGVPRTAALPQVNVQVHAIDSRSFLDHSDEIASAVKEAVLQSHSLRDVIAEI